MGFVKGQVCQREPRYDAIISYNTNSSPPDEMLTTPVTIMRQQTENPVTQLVQVCLCARKLSQLVHN